MTIESVLSALTTVFGLVTPAAAAIWLYVQSRRARRDAKEDTVEARLKAASDALVEARVQGAACAARAEALSRQYEQAQALVSTLSATCERLRDDLSTCRTELALCRASLPPPSPPAP